MDTIKIGFIGYGNMAQAMATGLVSGNKIKADSIYACARNYEKLVTNASKLGIKPKHTALEIVNECNVIVLAVKPNQIESVVTMIKDHLTDKIVISIAAGYSFDQYEKLFNPNTHHISTIPNTPVAVNEGIIVCENKHSLTDDELKIFTRIFSDIALIEMVDTYQLSIAGTIGGCTPAFVAMFIEALGDAGVKHGLTRQASYRLAAKVLTGTGKLYLNSDTHPGEMKDAVCSPGGTTIKGVASLEKSGFRGSIIEAIDQIEGELVMKKKLYLIGGTMGVGKTTTSLILKEKLENAVFLDGDWCWDMSPFIVNEETKKMVMDNIVYLLNNYIKCSVYENIIFCWVMHEQAIIDEILSKLYTDNVEVKVISLVCDKKALTQRLQKDVECHKRELDVIERSVERIDLYNKINSIKVDVSSIDAYEAANQIINL